MHPLLCLLLVMCGVCVAHYGDAYDSRNLIIREEPLAEDEVEIVECPVCDESEHWMASSEKCTIAKGKMFKRCRFGIYTNVVCGSRPDCYSGPGELCTEKREFDMYGKKCAPGYYCNKSLGVCTGISSTVDTTVLSQLNRYPYTWRRTGPKGRLDSFTPIRN